MVRLVDLTREMYHREPGNAGAIPPQVWPWRTHEETAPLYTTEYSFAARLLSFPDHASTHVDAPRHIDPDPDAPDIASLPLERFYGPALCLDVSQMRREGWIDRDDLADACERQHLPIAPETIVLLYTGHYRRTYPRPEFFTAHPGLTPEAAWWLHAQGVRNYGVEGPNAGHPSDREFTVHLINRKTGMIHMEGLANLEAVVGHRFTFIGFPLKIRDATGCPIRAVAVFDD